MFYGHQCMVLFASETRARAILAETLPEISAVQSLPSPDSGCDVHCALCVLYIYVYRALYIYGNLFSLAELLGSARVFIFRF